MKHTPGPWMIAETNQDDEQISAEVHAPSGYIASVLRILDDESTPEDIAEHLANARLIAAAPELLEALEAIMLHIRILKSRDPSILDDVLTAVAEEVIRKARGE